MNKVTKKSIFILIGIFLIFLLSKAMLLNSVWYKIWGDELLYNDMARSIAQTGTFKFANMYGPNEAYLYPLLLSIVFKFYSAETITVTTRLLGILLMTSTIFPTYLLAKKMRYSNNIAILMGVISISLPDMLQSLFTVTEVLAYPLFMWTIYFFYSDLDDEKFNKNTFFFAIASYLSYLTRSLSLTIALAYITYILIIAFYFLKNGKRELLKKYMIKAVGFLVIFALLYKIIPEILIYTKVLSKSDNATLDTGMMEIINGLKNNFFYTIMNWSSGIMWYLFYTILSFGIFTIILPATHSYEEKKERHFALFLNLLLIFWIGVITIIIYAREDPIQNMEKRVHLRYLFYFFMPYLLLMYKINFKKLKWSIGSMIGVGFVFIYIVCNRFIYLLRDTLGVESMWLSVIRLFKKFLVDYPYVENFILVFVLVCFLAVYLLIRVKGWESFLKRYFPCMLGIWIISNSLCYIKEVQYVTRVGNMGYKERNIPIAEVLNKYQQGEVVLLAQSLGSDNEIQTLQLILEKCVDKISIDEFQTQLVLQKGRINLNTFERTPFIYAKEQGHILKNAKYIGMRKWGIEGKYIIENNIIYEDDYFILYELQDGEFIVPSSKMDIYGDDWIGHTAQIIYYFNPNSVGNNKIQNSTEDDKIQTTIQLDKGFNPNESIKVNIDNGREIKEIELTSETFEYISDVYQNEEGIYCLKIEIPEEYLFQLEEEDPRQLGCKVKVIP